MISDFPRILTLLRREKKLSQKQAAQDLGISQALLSHYENGIRECGLDFVLKAAEYYNVSCDYLLGRSPNRSGLTVTVEEMPDGTEFGKENTFDKGILCVLNKKLIMSSLNILYDFLNKSGSQSLVTEVSDFLQTAVYRMFRIVYGANSKNENKMFKLNSLTASRMADATMQMCESNAIQIASEDSPDGMDSITHPDSLLITTESLSNQYGQQAASFLSMLNNVEKRIKGISSSPKKK